MHIITYVKGDATHPIAIPAIIAHVCNNKGGWGAGFTKALTGKFGPSLKDFYQGMIKSNANLGGASIQHINDNIFICHMIAQNGFRKPENPVPLDYDSLDICLGRLYKVCRILHKNMTIHMPRIGCGLAGGTWDRVEPLILKHMTAPTYVYDLTSN